MAHTAAQIKGKWTQFKGQGAGAMGHLTDDDLREQLAGFQERYGIAKEEAERQVDEWSRRMDLPVAKRYHSRRDTAASSSGVLVVRR